jgi:hypothetical protein
MPSLEQSAPRLQDADAAYFYRRPLTVRELLPAIGVAIGAGLFAFYVTRLLLQRTPLRIERSTGPRRRSDISERTSGA